MKRVTHLFVLSLTGCLLVASLLSSCTGQHGPRPVPSPGGPQPDASDAEPPSTTRVQIGVASWYGKEFHGRPTASGEIYDMYQPTAAHLTAPLGTHALVTNLDNGQSVRVRINDRGPYKPRRILDLSYEAARQIDLVRRGSGRVQIDFLAEPALVVQPTLTTVDTSPDQRSSVLVIETPGMEPLALPGGPYQEQNNAVRVAKPLTTMYPNVWLSMAPEGVQPLHRIGLGPFNSQDEAERVVRAVKARGYTVQVIAMEQ